MSAPALVLKWFPLHIIMYIKVSVGKVTSKSRNFNGVVTTKTVKVN